MKYIYELYILLVVIDEKRSHYFCETAEGVKIETVPAGGDLECSIGSDDDVDRVSKYRYRKAGTNTGYG